MTKHTNIYFDFEFIDDGKEIIPISLGMCTDMKKRVLSDDANFWENGKELYIEYEFDPARANDWVRENVFPHLNQPDFAGHGHSRMVNAASIKRWVTDVCGDTKPQFWGYYPSYDWVCLCQHWGMMTQGPAGWPIRPECLMQFADSIGMAKEDFPAQPKDTHNALTDAKWNRELHAYLYKQWEAAAP